jgi:hypothetical protein
MDITKELSLNTGDIILFKGNSLISYALEYFGNSRYSHVGIILKNPKFLNKDLEDGIYLLESGWNPIPDSEDNKIKIGVQIHKLENILNLCSKNTVYVRHIITNRDENFYTKLNDIHKDIHNIPYDLNIFDWILAKYNLEKEIVINNKYKNTKDFWCSSLVAYIFDKLGLIQDVNWSLIAPREFSKDGKYIKFLCNIEDEKILY